MKFWKHLEAFWYVFTYFLPVYRCFTFNSRVILSVNKHSDIDRNVIIYKAMGTDH